MLPWLQNVRMLLPNQCASCNFVCAFSKRTEVVKTGTAMLMGSVLFTDCTNVECLLNLIGNCHLCTFSSVVNVSLPFARFTMNIVVVVELLRLIF